MFTVVQIEGEWRRFFLLVRTSNVLSLLVGCCRETPHFPQGSDQFRGLFPSPPFPLEKAAFIKRFAQIGPLRGKKPDLPHLRREKNIKKQLLLLADWGKNVHTKRRGAENCPDREGKKNAGGMRGGRRKNNSEISYSGGRTKEEKEGKPPWHIRN